MGKLLSVIVILSLFFGCKNFETKKVSADELKSKSLKEVNWKKLSQYPSFPACQKVDARERKRECFEKELARHIYHSLESKKIVLLDSMREEIRLRMEITKEGKARLKKIQLSDSLQEQAPDLKQWLRNSIRELPELNPGHKRGIPVKTSFEIPILIQSD